jgi:hypothetical protein
VSPRGGPSTYPHRVSRPARRRTRCCITTGRRGLETVTREVRSSTVAQWFVYSEMIRLTPTAGLANPGMATYGLQEMAASYWMRPKISPKEHDPEAGSAGRRECKHK